jgi:hypothetical protein
MAVNEGAPLEKRQLGYISLAKNQALSAIN